ncbi:MAG: hypothetical protein ACXVXP_00495 [Mycobacteriaceae bacterium]
MAVLDLPPWTPQVSDVATRLIARTRQPNGVLAGTFNSSTLPTDVQVQAIIDQVTRLLVPRLGEVPVALADSATALVALKAACVVEASYFIEQVNTEMSAYKDMVAEYMAALKDWDEAARGEEPGGSKLASLPVGTLYPGYATGTY